MHDVAQNKYTHNSEIDSILESDGRLQYFATVGIFPRNAFLSYPVVNIIPEMRMCLKSCLRTFAVIWYLQQFCLSGMLT